VRSAGIDRQLRGVTSRLPAHVHEQAIVQQRINRSDAKQRRGQRLQVRVERRNCRTLQILAARERPRELSHRLQADERRALCLKHAGGERKIEAAEQQACRFEGTALACVTKPDQRQRGEVRAGGLAAD
jgi:hypothetical protein